MDCDMQRSIFSGGTKITRTVVFCATFTVTASCHEQSK